MNTHKFVLWPNKTRLEAFSRMEQLINLELKDKAVDVLISLHKEPKTPAQQGWFHYLCRYFGDEVGLNEGQVKEVVKAQKFGWKYISIGGIDMPIAGGSSEDLDKVEYSELIEILNRLAAESEVILPNPRQR